MSFPDRLVSRMGEFGPLCVGIDPHASLLHAWGLPDTADGARDFGLRVVEALAAHAAAFKPQSAFFERHGSAGVAALEDVLGAGRAAGVPMILDVKRGDIGSTMDGYADAFLSGPGEADAVTLSPYLGPGSLERTARRFAAAGKGVFVLALTSNPEGALVQHAGGAGSCVAGRVFDAARSLNADLSSKGLGPVGLVVGATIGDAARRLDIDLSAFNGLFLAPGVGAQGAGAPEISEVFGSARNRVLASASRSVLHEGPRADGLVRGFVETRKALAF